MDECGEQDNADWSRRGGSENQKKLEEEEKGRREKR